MDQDAEVISLRRTTGVISHIVGDDQGPVDRSDIVG